MLSQLSEHIHSTVIGSFRIAVLSLYGKTLAQRLMDSMGMDGLSVINDHLPILLLCREIGVAMKKEPQVQEGGGIFSVLSLSERKALFSSLQNRDVHLLGAQSQYQLKNGVCSEKWCAAAIGGPSILSFCSLLRLPNAKAPDSMIMITRPWLA